MDIDVKGSKTNRKYIAFFALFTLIPSILISIFSLFLFSFALEKYLDKKITTVVNNSYEIAKNYVDEVKNRIESDIILIGYDLNRNVNIFYDNPKNFNNILWSQKYLRNVDEIHLIDSLGNLIASTLKDSNLYEKPNEKALEMVFDEERPLKIINAIENQSAAILKLNAYIDTYLYVEKFLDSEFSITIIESGNFSFDKNVNTLNEGQSKVFGNFPHENYMLKSARVRMIGGTSNVWAGWSGPLLDEDFKKKDWIPNSGWQINYEDLKNYYFEAQKILGLSEFIYDEKLFYQ
jgi:nitrogen fixation/metabolism regulation signal transduction histidine kinase